MIVNNILRFYENLRIKYLHKGEISAENRNGIITNCPARVYYKLNLLRIRSVDMLTKTLVRAYIKKIKN
jgi:hypothetical protein